MKVVVAILLLAAAALVHALPTGAPAAACPNIFPVGHINPANNITDVNQGPFALDISALASTDGMGYAYVPGTTYTRELCIFISALCFSLRHMYSPQAHPTMSV